MSLPVIAITNASTCLTDPQVEAALESLQRQVSLDFKAYWDLDCELVFLAKQNSLIAGWWQISIVDDPDPAGALGFHELTSQGMPLGKVFARLDLRSGASWTVTLSHELLEMLADPWINWCAQGSDRRVESTLWKPATRWKLMSWVMRLTACWFRTSSLPHGSIRRKLIASISSATSPGGCSLLLGVYFRPRRRRLDAIHSAERSGSAGGKQAAAADYEESRVEKKSAVTFGGGFPANRRGTYFLRQRTPSLVISTNRPAEVNSARIASEA
jgi:hypothetical protein